MTEGPSTQTTASPVSGWGSAVKEAFRYPPFVVGFVLLLLAAGGLQATVSYLELAFRKQPVPLRHDLLTIPRALGAAPHTPWRMIGFDERLPSDIEHVLGTEQYIFREYVDVRLIGEELFRALEKANPADRARLMTRVPPNAHLKAAVTYYTGLVDTVAHIPDRCYVADGYEASESKAVTWRLPGGRTVDLRFITFQDQSGRTSVNRNVGYFFHCNGQYQNSVIGVRTSLQNLFEPHGYYAKVELMNLISDGAESQRVMADFLGYLMPEVERCLPDWQAVKATATSKR